MKSSTEWQLKQILPEVEKVVARGLHLKRQEITAEWNGKEIEV